MSSPSPLSASDRHIEQAAATLLEEALLVANRLAAEAFLDDQYDVGPAYGAAGYLSEARGSLPPADTGPSGAPIALGDHPAVRRLADRLDASADELAVGSPLNGQPGAVLRWRSAAASMYHAATALRAALPEAQDGS